MKATKTESGKYRVLACRTVGGVKQRKSITAPTKKEAEYKALQWSNCATQSRGSMTLNQAYEKYIELKTNVLSPATIRSYKTISKTHLKEIMPLKIDSLTDEKIQFSINIMAANRSPKTVRNAFNLLTAVLKLYRPDYSPKVTLPQKTKKEIIIPSDDEIKKLLQCAKETSLYIPILLAAFGGMRRAEICALDLPDIIGNIVTVNKSIVCNASGKWVEKPPKSFSGNRNIELIMPGLL